MAYITYHRTPQRGRIDARHAVVLGRLAALGLNLVLWVGVIAVCRSLFF